MKLIKRLGKLAGMLLFGCLFAVCMVLGVVPIIPKRREQSAIEIKVENVETLSQHTVTITQTNRIAE